MMSEKKRLREKYKLIIKSISDERKKEASIRAISFLKEITKGQKKVLSFFNTDEEIDLYSFNSLLAQEKRLFLPKIENNSLSIYKVDDLSTLIKNNSYPIWEPSIGSSSPLDSFFLILVPGVAFSETYRLGRGKGFYDKLLSSFEGTSIGIGFKEQYCSTLPIETFDSPLSKIFLF